MDVTTYSPIASETIAEARESLRAEFVARNRRISMALRAYESFAKLYDAAILEGDWEAVEFYSQARCKAWDAVYMMVRRNEAIKTLF